ncbi:DUF726 domain-containing protein [Vibrio splendidus]|uniref:DUF726 domain-containing protein n=1 Tax=Vibrio echinoideorum TaxID=2100116 RepID=UPI00354EC13C
MLNSLKKRAGQLSDKVIDVKQSVSEQISETIPDAVKERAAMVSDGLDDLLDTVGDLYDSELDEKETYCSWCFEKHTCTLDEKGGLSRNIYICDGCQNKVTKCRACDNKAKFAEVVDSMALTEDVGVWSNNFCAVHAGEIAKFETLNWKLSSIGEYRDIVERKDTNFKKIGTTAAYTVGGAAVIAPLALAAAPAIGGAIGTSILGYSGAAATNAGLATLGGGAIAAGGAGMAGGVAVVTAAGSALGGKYGAVISNSYFGEIDGFEIVKIKPGSGTPILCIDGFLNEKSAKSPDSWLQPITQIYPENPIYYIKWESKRLRDLATSFSGVGGKEAGKNAILKASMSASKAAAKKLAPVGLAIQALGLVSNPWSIASIKAYQTGALLADIIARTDEKYILVGHSLGARVIYSCLSALKTIEDKKYIDTVHLLGGAVNNLCSNDQKDASKPNWYGVEKAVYGNIYNYFSKKDDVLKYLYRVGEGVKFDFGDPIGRNPVSHQHFTNIDVTNIVAGHTLYKERILDFLRTD